jgi:pimeloyl-ACP methyl ester carboxylesterase
MPTVVLAHSPVVGAAAWGRLPAVLASRPEVDRVVVVDVTDDDRPPYAGRYVARAALQVRDAVGDAPVVLVGHSGAGYLLPALGLARRAARAPVTAYVFLDAGLPPLRPATRLDQLRAEDPAYAEQLEPHLAAGGTFPDWSDDDLRTLVPDDDLRAAVVKSVRPRTQEFFTEPLPVAPDWPEAPCGYLRLSPAYDVAARLARSRGWPVVDGPDDRPGGHFAFLVDPDQVADDLMDLLSAM